MVLLIVRTLHRECSWRLVGGEGSLRAVQPGETWWADLLELGVREPAAMPTPAVLTGAAGGGQEALGHAASLMTAQQGFSVTYPSHSSGDRASRQSPAATSTQGSRQTHSSANPSRTGRWFCHLELGICASTCTSVLKKLKALDLQVWGKLTKWKDIGHQGRAEFLPKRAHRCKRFHFDCYPTETLDFS